MDDMQAGRPVQEVLKDWRRLDDVLWLQSCLVRHRHSNHAIKREVGPLVCTMCHPTNIRLNIIFSSFALQVQSADLNQGHSISAKHFAFMNIEFLESLEFTCPYQTKKQSNLRTVGLLIFLHFVRLVVGCPSASCLIGAWFKPELYGISSSRFESWRILFTVSKYQRSRKSEPLDSFSSLSHPPGCTN